MAHLCNLELRAILHNAVVRSETKVQLAAPVKLKTAADGALGPADILNLFLVGFVAYLNTLHLL